MVSTGDTQWHTEPGLQKTPTSFLCISKSVEMEKEAIKSTPDTLLQGQTSRGIYIFPKRTIFAVEVSKKHQEHRTHLDMF